MKNKIIDVFKVAGRLVSITVSNPDFSGLKMGKKVRIGDKNYTVHSIPMFHGKSVLDRDTFTIEYTEDDLMNEQVVF